MSRLVDSRLGSGPNPTDGSARLDQTDASSVDAPTTSRPRTPLRAVLIGEHCARTLDWLTSLARPSANDDLMLDMSTADARVLVASLDAYCDWVDSNDEQRSRERRYQLTLAEQGSSRQPTTPRVDESNRSFRVAIVVHRRVLTDPVRSSGGPSV